MTLDVGKTLYHLTAEENIQNILSCGLLPSNKSADGVNYEENRVYFFTQPVLRTSEIDEYLQGRIQIEIIYDGSYELLKDEEYRHKDNFTVYAVKEEPITVQGISSIQPVNMNLIDDTEKIMVLERIIKRVEGLEDLISI